MKMVSLLRAGTVEEVVGMGKELYCDGTWDASDIWKRQAFLFIPQ